MFPQLGDCAAVHGALRQGLNQVLQLLSTVLQDTATDVVVARRAAVSGPPEGFDHTVCAEGE